MADVSPGSPSGRLCAFCGQRMTRAKGNMPNKETEEHGFPKWMMKILSDIGDASQGVTHTIREGVRGPVLRQWSAGTFDIVARKVCRECNRAG